MAARTYLDFEIAINERQGDTYPVEVLRSPAGETTGELRLPFEQLKLQNHLLQLQNALLRGTIPHRAVLPPEYIAVEEFGQALFHSLFAGDILSRYDVSREVAQTQGKGLRIKLRIRPAELATWPWEFLFDSRGSGYICLSTRTLLVRYLDLPHPISFAVVDGPLRILAVIASPDGLPPLDVQRERKRLDQALSPLVGKGIAKVTWLDKITLRKFRRAMQHEEWHIIHFIGHGGFDEINDIGFLAIEDEQGQLYKLQARTITILLGDQPSLRLITLNACEGARGSSQEQFSSIAAQLVQRGVPAVLAMQFPITDEAATLLSETFYETLADGLPGDVCLAEARKSVSMELPHSLEWGVPVLTTHSHVSNLFMFETKSSQEKHDTSSGLRVSSLSIDNIATPALPTTDMLPLRTAEQYIRRASHRWNVGDYIGALNDCNKAVEIETESSAAYTIRATSNFCLQNYENALFDCNHALTLANNDSESARALVARSVVRWLLQDSEALSEDLHQVAKLASPSSLIILIEESIDLPALVAILDLITKKSEKLPTDRAKKFKAGTYILKSLLFHNI